jgi:TonB family protein
MFSKMSAVENREIASQPKPILESKPLLASWVSLVTHGALLLLLILGGRQAWKVRPVTTRGGNHTTLLYWDKGMGAGLAKTHTSGKMNLSPTKKASHTNPLNRQKPQPVKQAVRNAPEVSASPAGSSTSQSQLSGSGSGTQDATPAFPTYSPNPPVRDRSLLPQSETNVVVDVNVSAQGDVLDEKLVSGLGNSIDQTILETVRSWKFHPATLDGSPVASVSELVFPMSQRYRG